MHKLRTLARSAALLVALAASNSALAELRVGAGPGCSFPTIQQALQSGADNGELIKIMQGRYIENLHIHAQSVTLIGNYANCLDDTQIAGDTAVTSPEGSTQSVVQMDGFVDVVLSDLVIQHGRVSNTQEGGGINFTGHGTLQTIRTKIRDNSAGFGGGISVIPDGELANIVLDDGTLISGNFATVNGAGVGIEGNTRLYLTGGSSIAFNDAGAGNGGGITVVGPAGAEVSSTGYTDELHNFVGAIWGNYALNGGGIAVQDNGVVRLVSTHPSQPVYVNANGSLGFAGRADTQLGGGIYLQGDGGSLCGWGYSITSNSAQDGAAIYAENGTLSLFRDQALVQCAGYFNEPAGTDACAVGASCNSIDNNGTNNAVVRSRGDGYFFAQQLELRNNSAVRLIEADASAGINLIDCLIATNVSDLAVVQTDHGAPLSMNNCTIANNTITGLGLLSLSGSLHWSDSIMWEPTALAQGVRSFNFSGSGDRDVTHVIFTDADRCQDCYTGPVSALDPQFIDFAGGDFHLKPSSPAIDYSPTGQSIDLEGRTRGIPLINSTNGPYDVGAYEVQALPPSDVIYKNGFESR